MAASCTATCRPIAPTPMTTPRQAARRSGGTISRCRKSRSANGWCVKLMVGLANRFVEDFIQLRAPRFTLPPRQLLGLDALTGPRRYGHLEPVCEADHELDA